MLNVKCPGHIRSHNDGVHVTQWAYTRIQGCW